MIAEAVVWAFYLVVAVSLVAAVGGGIEKTRQRKRARFVGPERTAALYQRAICDPEDRAGRTPIPRGMP